MDKKYNIRLTGIPDDVLIRHNNLCTIIDYKTAKYTGTQDQLFPMYSVQLNAYSLIAKQLGLFQAKDLAVVYMEPVTDNSMSSNDIVHQRDGFIMNFKSKIVWVKVDINIVQSLLKKVRDIYDMRSIPNGRGGCKDCQKLIALFNVAMHK